MNKKILSSFIILSILSMALAGCSAGEIEKLKEENDWQKKRITELEDQIKSLENERNKENSILSDRAQFPSISYCSYDGKKRFIPEERPILVYPAEGVTAVAKVPANTVVEVVEAGFSETPARKLWLYVIIPTYDAPMDNHGWIPEEETDPLTQENQKLVLGDVYLEKGTPIYEVYAYEQIATATSSTLIYSRRGRIEKKKGDYVYLNCPGGEAFWVAEEFIIYPSLENE